MAFFDHYVTQEYFGSSVLTNGKTAITYMTHIKKDILRNQEALSSLLGFYAGKINSFSCENLTKWFEKLSEKQQKHLMEDHVEGAEVSCCSLCNNTYDFDHLLHIDDQGNVCHGCQYIITCIALGVDIPVYDIDCQDMEPTQAMVQAVMEIETKTENRTIYRVTRGKIEQYTGHDSWVELAMTPSKNAAVSLLRKMQAVPMYPELKEGDKGYNRMWSISNV